MYCQYLANMKRGNSLNESINYESINKPISLSNSFNNYYEDKGLPQNNNNQKYRKQNQIKNQLKIIKNYSNKNCFLEEKRNKNNIFRNFNQVLKPHNRKELMFVKTPFEKFMEANYEILKSKYQHQNEINKIENICNYCPSTKFHDFGQNSIQKSNFRIFRTNPNINLFLNKDKNLEKLVEDSNNCNNRNVAQKYSSIIRKVNSNSSNLDNKNSSKIYKRNNRCLIPIVLKKDLNIVLLIRNHLQNKFQN